MLFTAAIVSLLGITLISTSLQENKISHYQEDSTAAQYLAEGGIQKALVALKDHPNWQSDGYWDTLLDREIPSGNGTYTLSFNEKSNNLLEVISTGKSGSGDKTLKADVKITRVNKVFENMVALNSQSAIKLSGNADIQGNLFSNTDLIFDKNTHVHGNITCLGKTKIIKNPTIEGELYSGDDIIISGNPNIKGNVLGMSDLTISGNPNIKSKIQINGLATISEGNYDIIYGGVGPREPIEFPEISENLLERYRQLAMDTGKYYEDESFPEYISGTVFIDSGISLDRNIRGNGVLFINGNLKLGKKSGVTSDKDGAVVIVVNGDVYVQANGKLECVIFATGDFSVSGEPKIYGSIVSKNITGSGNLDIRFLEDLQERLPHNTPGVFETKVELETLTY